MNIKEQRGVSTFWGISFILMEVTVVVFVFYILYFFWIENPTPTANIYIIKTFKGGTVTIPKDVETTGWLVYSNSSYGFSLKYPTDYKISEDEIVYGLYEGRVFSLSQQDQENFSLRFFPAEGNESVKSAFERLTTINPSVRQSFQEEVGGREAIVYRRAPGQTPSDYIYFIGNGYVFESAFDEFSAQILATFKFID